MVLKLALIIICISLIVTLGVTAFLRPGTQSGVKWEDKKSLVEIARRTKAEGKKNIRVLGPAHLYPGRNIDFPSAVESFSLVIAEPVENKSYLANDNDIFTWSKFRLLETISARPTCTICVSTAEVPLDAQPLRTDEFVIVSSGGTLNIDGVDVTLENKDFPPFINGQKYLLFVSFTPLKVALLAGGPSGVFRINRNDDLEAVDKSNSRLAEAIDKRFERKLSLVKSHIKP